MDSHKLIEHLQNENKKYRELILRFEEELKRMPKGNINFKKRNGHVYFYHYCETAKGERKQRYIPQNENQLIADLNRKRFIKLSITKLQNNVYELERFLEIFRPYDVDEILACFPVDFLAIDYTSHKKGDCTDWEKEEYHKNPLYPEGLLYGTVGGLKVRSKSEAIIAGLLEANHVPFRYEASLHIGEKTYYPDFTIQRPRDKRILYWEHFGMADDEEYSLAMEKKLAEYKKHGIVPWTQLITTYEIEKGSMDAQDIQNIISAFIL